MAGISDLDGLGPDEDELNRFDAFVSSAVEQLDLREGGAHEEDELLDRYLAAALGEDEAAVPAAGRKGSHCRIIVTEDPQDDDAGRIDLDPLETEETPPWRAGGAAAAASARKRAP